MKILRPFFVCTLIALLLQLTLSHCANPVPPSGGDKDTSSPQITSIRNSVLKDGRKRILISFDENISSTGTIQISPKIKSSNALRNLSEQRVKKTRLQLDVPAHTNTIYLNATIVDLNEKNRLKQPNLIMNEDTGDIFISVNTPNSAGQKKKNGVFINLDSFVYLPETLSNGHYHFDGMATTSFKTYVIENDNNQNIDINEPYNAFYSTPRASDTFDVKLYPPHKNYRNSYILSNNIHCIIGAPIFQNWLSQGGLQLNNDTLLVESKHYSAIQQDLAIDSAITSNKKISVPNKSFGIFEKDTFYSTLSNYGYNSSNYCQKINGLTSINNTNDTIKKNYTNLGKVLLTNPMDSVIMVRITSSKMDYIVEIKNKFTVSILLPEGQYQTVYWINNLKEEYQYLNIDGYNFRDNDISLYPELFHIPMKPLLIKKNLDNTLILPKIGTYNTGVTTK